MSAEEPDDIERTKALIAAEYALGLLEGEELLDARGRMASDDGFLWRKVWWDNWLAPLSDEVAGAEPGVHVWERITAEVAGSAEDSANPAHSAKPGAEVIDLTPRLRRWQWTAALTSAAAAVLAAVMVLGPETTAPVPGTSDTPQIAAAEPLFAQVPIGDTGLRLDVTYIPESEQMLVGAIGLTADGVHDHELWLVPADGGELQSLGVVAPGEVHSMAVPAEIARNLGNGVELVLTVEPIGGKPEGEDAGPVVAQGAFERVTA